ncbi:MAG TPA: phage protein Gp27 family protein [Candidatus Binataceae bacterium]|jgi:hypothetical protein|nr:phage protein Gp27 family protein [Candidatus Binataceae bacterium]
MPRSSIFRLPAELRRELDERLLDNGFADYRGLAAWLRERGHEIGVETIRRYGSKLERRLEAVRLATLQARAAVPTGVGDEDGGRLAEALLRLVQQKMFDVLVDLAPGDVKQLNLTAVARSIADLGRLKLLERKWQEDLRDRIARRAAAAEKQVMRVVQADGGISEAAQGAIRRALEGIVE